MDMGGGDNIPSLDLKIRDVEHGGACLRREKRALGWRGEGVSASWRELTFSDERGESVHPWTGGIIGS